ncbi:MAG: hypothetical protein H8E37_11850 [Planctomycetes bacterium]|nr:hypothetical protein [Planctomycetota bacterium]
MDNVRHAAAGTRTPPDWWQELHREERRPVQSSSRRDPERAISPGILAESPDRLREIVQQHIDAARRV